MRITFKNNWKIKRHWSNLFHLNYGKRITNEWSLLLGVFGFFIFIVID